LGLERVRLNSLALTCTWAKGLGAPPAPGTSAGGTWPAGFSVLPALGLPDPDADGALEEGVPPGEPGPATAPWVLTALGGLRLGEAGQRLCLCVWWPRHARLARWRCLG